MNESLDQGGGGKVKKRHVFQLKSVMMVAVSFFFPLLGDRPEVMNKGGC